MVKGYWLELYQFFGLQVTIRIRTYTFVTSFGTRLIKEDRCDIIFEQQERGY